MAALKTPNVQYIQDAVEAEFGSQVRCGAWLCRRIDGTFTWSQHAYHQENHLDPDFFGNAVDIFPVSMAVGDQVKEFVLDEFGEVVAHFLWRVKNHFNHGHLDTWPQGINLPPCKGGQLQVRHKDGRVGREFTYDFDNTPPLPSDPDPVPPIMEDVLLPLVHNPKVESQDVGRLQELINETFYPNHAPGLTVDGIYGNGTAAAVRKWLVPFTNDTDPEVVAGRKVNFREFNQLIKHWILDFLPK